MRFAYCTRTNASECTYIPCRRAGKSGRWACLHSVSSPPPSTPSNSPLPRPSLYEQITMDEFLSALSALGQRLPGMALRTPGEALAAFFERHTAAMAALPS